jgi:hypothetical protein
VIGLSGTQKGRIATRNRLHLCIHPARRPFNRCHPPVFQENPSLQSFCSRFFDFGRSPSSSVILSFYLENQKTFLVDDLLAAMVWSLGYEKALMKKYTDSTNPVQFQLKRISQPSDLPTSKPEKKKGKKPKPKTKKTPSSSSLLVPELIAEGLREMRGHLENCFTSTGSLEPCHLFRDEDQSLPLKLEICSGFGEWAVKQVCGCQWISTLYCLPFPGSR